MTDATAALLAAAGRLAETAGRGRPLRLTPLAGGKNNRVFRVETVGEPLVLKSYHRDARDTRDRLGHEWAFLTYVWARGVRVVPEPLAADPEHGLALYPFVQGRKLGQDEIDAEAVRRAAEFVVAANAEPREIAALAPGSEACFTLSEHIDTVERRVARLSALDPDAPHREDAEAFVQDRLRPAWALTRSRCAESASSENGEARDVIVSPSDFGFHNALFADDGALTFIDFEYAGRDDPAKLVCDFFCCPEAPPPAGLRKDFVERISDGIGLSPAVARRAEALLDAYRIKWACIVLNDFLPVGAARRAFAASDDRAARCAGQLEKAAAILAQLDHHAPQS